LPRRDGTTDTQHLFLVEPSPPNSLTSAQTRRPPALLKPPPPTSRPHRQSLANAALPNNPPPRNCPRRHPPPPTPLKFGTPPPNCDNEFGTVLPLAPILTIFRWSSLVNFPRSSFFGRIRAEAAFLIGKLVWPSSPPFSPRF